MRSNLQQGSRSKSLKDQIYETINFTNFQSVANLLRSSRKWQAPYHPFSSHHSLLRHNLDSPIIRNDLSHRFTPSPPSKSHSHSVPHRSTDRPKIPKNNHNSKKCQKMSGASRSYKKQSYLLSNPKKVQAVRGRKAAQKMGQRGTGVNFSGHGDKSIKSLGINSRSRDRGGSSRLNLSSIVQQESSQSKVTPSKEGSPSRKTKKRRLSGQGTRKKERNGVRQVVWRRLQRSLRDPEKFHRLLGSQYLSIRFRVLRKRLIEIQISVQREMMSLAVILEKGNLQCQGVQQNFSRLQAGSVFSLYAAVRGVDLNQPMRLPKLQIEAVVGHQVRFQKVITLPYCWLHFAEQSTSVQPQRSRIRTKACVEQLVCSRASVRGLLGVVAGWGEWQGRGQLVWSSRLGVGQDEFEVRVVEREGRFVGELAGRGEERLTKMLEFLCVLLC